MVSVPLSCTRSSAPNAVPVPHEIAAPAANDSSSGSGNAMDYVHIYLTIAMA